MQTLARGKVAQARALIEHTDTAWWFDGVDLRAQAWLSIHGTLDKFIYGTPPDTMAWRRPENPSRPWERYAQKPLGNQITSTLYGPYLTSKLVAYDKRAGDYYCEFPLAWWSMCFLEDVRCSRFMAHRTGMTYASGIPQKVLRTTVWCQIGGLCRKSGTAST